MNHGRARRRTKTSSLLSSIIIITTTIITTANIADITMMTPASSWYPDIVVIIIIIITTITIITASTAATIIEVARCRMMKTGPSRSCFFMGFFVWRVFFAQTGPTPDQVRGKLSLENGLFLAGLLLRRAMQMPIGAVEHGVG